MKINTQIWNTPQIKDKLTQIISGNNFLITTTIIIYILSNGHWTTIIPLLTLLPINTIILYSKRKHDQEERGKQ